MISEQTILSAERLREDLEGLRKDIRHQYKKKTSQVTSDSVRTRAARLSEIWLVEIATDTEAVMAIGSEMTANLSVHFQRILTFGERATIRSKYETEIAEILNGYSLTIVLPLKQARGKPTLATAVKKDAHTPIVSAFVGQSFSKKDKEVNDFVFAVLQLIGINAVTGEQPKADYISEKVKKSIEEQQIFVGIFTRRDKIVKKPEWTTSAWVIDEKAYALGRQKRLILLKENGVGSIGGIQGDYEYLSFSRDKLGDLATGLLRFFEVTNRGLRA
jgi:hypothetical protein